MVENIHERVIKAPIHVVGGLINKLATPEDALWPKGRWPRMQLDRPLGVGASGGHGPIRYRVEAYEPGRSVRFRFTAPRGFEGTHGFDAEEVSPGRTRLRHAIRMRLNGKARISWPLMIRWLHDACVEDALDCAEAHCEQKNVEPRKWSYAVRLLRSAARRGRKEARPGL